MKTARIVVLTVAVAAGGIAALLAGRSEKPPEPKAEVPKFDTVDILVAKSDVARGQTLTPADVFWQAWPSSTASGNFIRRTERPKAIENVSPNDWLTCKLALFAHDFFFHNRYVHRSTSWRDPAG